MRSGWAGIYFVLWHVPYEQEIRTAIIRKHTFRSTDSLAVKGLGWRARGPGFESRNRQVFDDN